MFSARRSTLTHWLLPVVLAVVLTAAACSASPTATPTATATASPTPEATATPEPPVPDVEAVVRWQQSNNIMSLLVTGRNAEVDLAQTVRGVTAHIGPVYVDEHVVAMTLWYTGLGPTEVPDYTDRDAVTLTVNGGEPLELIRGAWHLDPPVQSYGFRSKQTIDVEGRSPDVKLTLLLRFAESGETIGPFEFEFSLAQGQQFSVSGVVE